MKDTISMRRTRFVFGRSTRALLAGASVIGLLFVLGVFFSSSPVATTKVAAAAPGFQGGATVEMLDYALNFGDASDFAVFGGRGVRNQGESNIRGRVGSGAGQVEGIPGADAAPESYGQAK